MNENEEISTKFKLSIHSPQVLKHPTNFVNFYSGGPKIGAFSEKVFDFIYKSLLFNEKIYRKLGKYHFPKQIF